MAEDQDGDKTEDPTPSRRKEAREEGNVARSQDLSASALLVALLIALWMLGSRLWEAMLGVATRSLGESLGQTTTADLSRLGMTTLSDVAYGILPLLGAVVVVAVVANVAQVGLLLTPKKLQPNPGVLDPIKGLKKLFFESKTYVMFGMNLAKLAVVGAVAWWAVESELPTIVGLAQLDMAVLLGAAARSVFAVAIKVAIVLLILSFLDFAYQKWKHEQDLKMTKQQVKEEMKKMEGDPHIKQRRRQMAMQRSMQRINQDVPGADVVVTNPTHFAVAIKYDDTTMHAPRVVAKGADALAMRIRELATANGVAIVERPPLARALYRTVEVGQEIPEDFYSAVAELLAYVYRLERELAGTSGRP